MRVLWRASLRFLAHEPAQCALAATGIALGVAVVVGVWLIQHNARSAFERALDSALGAATHSIVAHDQSDFDERVLGDIRRQVPELEPTPVIAARVQVAGQRVALNLIGVDPLTSHARGASGAVLDAVALMRQPGAAALDAASAGELGLSRGQPLVIQADGSDSRLTLLATAPSTLLPPATVLVDLATAQLALQRVGRLSRIDLRARSRADARALRALHAELPAHLLLTDRGRAARSTATLTHAFYINLAALSLLALLVGGFMIYNTLAFLVVRRRLWFARLRALGAERRDLACVIAGEAALFGAVGGVAGCALGYLCAHALLAPFGQTLYDHYFDAGAIALELPARVLGGGIVLALVTAQIAALVPLRQVLAIEPAQAAQDSVLLRHNSAALARLAMLGLGVAALGAVLLLATERALLAGFAALAACIVAAMLCAPWLTQRLLEALSGRDLAVRRLAWKLASRGAARSLGRAGLAASALMAASATAIGIALMVASFRSAVDAWLANLLRADFYLATAHDNGSATLPPKLVATVRALPEVGALSQVRRLRLVDGDASVRVTAYELPAAARAGFSFIAGDAAHVWRSWEHADIAIVSQPLAVRAGYRVGDTLETPGPRGRIRWRIAGIYTDYGSEHGVIAISRARYVAHWSDTRINALGVYLAPRASSTRLARKLTALLADQRAVELWSNTQLRRHSLAVFDRTFAITDALTWFATAIAALGVFNALLSLNLDRAREYALLRALGMPEQRLRAQIFAQSALIVVTAVMWAVPLGLLCAVVLIDVINVRSFGWTMALVIAPWELVRTALLAFTAGVAAAVYPTWRASQDDPARALRYE
jgi:putative ABC transport system permease protein